MENTKKMRLIKNRGRKVLAMLLVFVMAVSTLTACGKSGDWRSTKTNVIDDNYRTWYEIFVYSFNDSDGDRIGDLQGVISKLDYVEDTGFNGIWLMPIMPSMSYHKYDVMDYKAIDPLYGTMEDFEQLVAECDKRGIKLIIDLVLNHTSSEHPWFKAACEYLSGLGKDEEPSVQDCPYYEYYNFVKGDPPSASYYRVGNTDYYYEGAFSDHMPDVNFDCEAVRKEFEDIMSFWLNKGVGGFRLDAVKHFYGESTGKNVEVLSWVNDYVKNINPNAYIVGECWDSMSIYTQYYASGIDSLFDFGFADSSGIITRTLTYNGEANSAQVYAKSLVKIQNAIREVRADGIDAPFFTNHDLARAAGCMRYDERKIKMAAALNVLMGGSAFVYYGEEIGMSGSGKDENKRAPMFWTEDSSSKGMTDGPADMEPQENRFASADEQIKNKDSIYSFYKDVILLRNQNPEIARGTVSQIEEITDEDIAAVTKDYNGSKVCLIYNLSETDEKQVTLSREKYGYTGIAGYLSADGSEVVLNDDTLTLPSYSVVLLK